jgi:hypothetical protein
VIEVDPTLVRLRVRVPWRPHDDVVVTVVVDVARRSDVKTEPRTGLISDDRPFRVRVKPRVSPVMDDRAPEARPSLGVQIRAHDGVVEPVTVDVSRARHRRPEKGRRLTTRFGPRRVRR